MHTNGPDHWGVYFRPVVEKGKRELDWVLMENYDYASHMKAREKVIECNLHAHEFNTGMEYKSFISHDGTHLYKLIR